MTYVEMFRDIVIDEVSTRVAIEARAGYPQGLVNRDFEAITGELMMADWERLSKLRSEDVIRAICYAPRSRLGNVKMEEF